VLLAILVSPLKLLFIVRVKFQVNPLPSLFDESFANFVLLYICDNMVPTVCVVLKILFVSLDGLERAPRGVGAGVMLMQASHESPQSVNENSNETFMKETGSHF